MLPRRLRRLPAHTLDDGLVVLEARGLRARLLGLALLRDLPPRHALLIPRCRSVHTYGMRFPLELTWLGPQGEVLRVDEKVGPNRVRRCAKAWGVIERASPPSRPAGVA